MPAHAHDRPTRRQLAALTLGALGIVYGDIGTSPLYSLRECFHGEHAVAPTPDNVHGVLSLIFWAIVIIVTLKYHVYVLRADNRGEGGILALMALVRPVVASPRARGVLVGLGLFGAALLYGDGVITPAISVLSAVEGLDVATSLFKPFILPLTVGILIGLFLLQRRGTAGIGAIFGPVMLVWFATLAVLGISGIARNPEVLRAVDPRYAWHFMAHMGWRGFLVLGAVFLVATGGEALYADMGHFGELPIQIDWFSVVAPSLLLNYFGQGALLVRDPAASFNPFYRLAPAWALYPLVALATAATVIASQAVISGAFSVTRQAIQLGYLPRMDIVQTSNVAFGQIYIPTINWLLMLATVGLVLGFRTSSSLAAAYGIAVTTTMVITTLLAFVVTRRLWHWNLWAAGAVTLAFLTVDLAFFGANMIKVLQGGWFPLLVAAIVYLLMVTWQQGRHIVAEKLLERSLPLAEFLKHLKPDDPHRVPGTAVFLTTDPQGTPVTLLHNLKHNKVLHEKVVLLTVVTEEIPAVPPEERLTVERLDQGFYRLTARYGFVQDPRAADVMKHARAQGLELDVMKTTFFLGRDTLLPDERGQSPLSLWRRRLFSFLSKNSERFNEFFHIPPNRVVELGMQVKL